LPATVYRELDEIERGKDRHSDSWGLFDRPSNWPTRHLADQTLGRLKDKPWHLTEWFSWNLCMIIRMLFGQLYNIWLTIMTFDQTDFPDIVVNKNDISPTVQYLINKYDIWPNWFYVVGTGLKEWHLDDCMIFDPKDCHEIGAWQ
jgi:hypothetical protein